MNSPDVIVKCRALRLLAKADRRFRVGKIDLVDWAARRRRIVRGYHALARIYGYYPAQRRTK